MGNIRKRFRAEDLRLYTNEDQVKGYIKSICKYIRLNKNDFIDTEFDARGLVKSGLYISFPNVLQILEIQIQSEQTRLSIDLSKMWRPSDRTLSHWAREEKWNGAIQEEEDIIPQIIEPEIRTYLKQLHMIDSIMNRQVNSGLLHGGRTIHNNYEIEASRLCYYGFRDHTGLKVDLIGQWAIYSELCLRLELRMPYDDIDFYFACTPWEDNAKLYSELAMRPADADYGSITNRQPNLWYMTEPIEPNQKSNTIWYVAFMGFYNYIDFKMRINAELRMPWEFGRVIYDFNVGDEDLELVQAENEGTLEPRALWDQKISIYNKKYGNTIQARHFNHSEIREDTKKLGGWRRLVTDGNSEYGMSRDKYFNKVYEKLNDIDFATINNINMLPFRDKREGNDLGDGVFQTFEGWVPKK